MRILTQQLLFLAVSCCFLVPAQAQVEAIKGKQYRLSKQHGPWMIMVASLKDRPGNEKRDGLTAHEAADQLVYQLRKTGIPAYTYEQKEVKAAVATMDRLGRQVQRPVKAQHGEVAVLAGNYDNSGDDVAQKTLTYVKAMHPNFVKDPNSGANYRTTKRSPTPLSGAFLTINPRLSPEEARQRKRDPLLLKLNGGTEYSLLQNPGKYSLIVASFYGKSLTLDKNRYQQLLDKFKVESDLDEAGMNAWQLAKALRQRGHEAYVFHDRYRSLVTIGSFESKTDPRISTFSRNFGAKVKEYQGRQVLTAEILTLPGRTANDPPVKTWLFDPSPTLIDVPRL